MLGSYKYYHMTIATYLHIEKRGTVFDHVASYVIDSLEGLSIMWTIGAQCWAHGLGHVTKIGCSFITVVDLIP